MSLDAELMEFLKSLAVLHVPRKEPDTMAYGEQYLVWCRACDGNQRRIWQPGDEPYECRYWTMAIELGVVKGA